MLSASSGMSKVVVLANQSLLDITLQEFGSLEGLMSFAILNNISIIDHLVPGLELNIDDSLIENSENVRYYNDNEIKPATAIVDDFIYNTLFAEGLFVNGLFD